MSLSIESGTTSPMKTVRVVGISVEDVPARLELEI